MAVRARPQLLHHMASSNNQHKQKQTNLPAPGSAETTAACSTCSFSCSCCACCAHVSSTPHALTASLIHFKTANSTTSCCSMPDAPGLSHFHIQDHDDQTLFGLTRIQDDKQCRMGQAWDMGMIGMRLSNGLHARNGGHPHGLTSSSSSNSSSSKFPMIYGQAVQYQRLTRVRCGRRWGVLFFTAGVSSP